MQISSLGGFFNSAPPFTIDNSISIGSGGAMQVPMTTVDGVQGLITISGNCVSGTSFEFQAPGVSSYVDASTVALSGSDFSCAAKKFKIILDSNFVGVTPAASQAAAGDIVRSFQMRVKTQTTKTDKSTETTVNDYALEAFHAAPVGGVSAPAAVNLANGSSYSLNGTCSATGGRVVVTGDLPTATSLNTTCSGNVWSLTGLNLTSIADGLHPLSITHYDSFGAFNSFSSNFSSDTVAPVLAFASPSNGAMLGTSVAVSGSCETGLIVGISGDLLSPYTAVCTAGSFSQAVQFSTGDGGKTITIVQTDAAGNSTTDSRIVTADTTAPVLLFSAPNDNSYVSSSATITGSCEAGLSVDFAGAGISAVSGTCTGGTFSQSVSFTAGDGTKLVTATQTDAAGNAATIQRNFLRDSVAPVLAFTSPATNTAASSGVTIAGTCEGTLDVIISGTGVSTQITTPCMSGSFLQVILFSSGDGTKQIIVSQTDAANNLGQASRDFIRDGTPPAISFSAPTPNTPAAGGLTISGSCETGLPVVLAGAGLASPFAATCSAGSFSQAITFTAGDGSKTVSISQTDAVGNSSSDSRTFINDVTPPTVLFASPAVNALVGNTATFTGTCEDGLAVDFSGSGLSSSSSTLCNAGTFSQSLVLSSGEGSKSITVTQHDAVGNTGSDTRAFMKDTLSPVIAITSPANGTYVIGSQTVSGTCENGLNVDFSGAGIQAATAILCSGGVFSKNVTFTSGQGDKIVTVSQTDLAANTGTASRTFVVDTVAPVVTITSAPANINGVNAASASFSGACSLNDGNVSLYANGIFVTSDSCSGTSWNINANLVSQADGDIDFVVKQTDAAGNVGVSTVLGLTKSTVAPSFTITAPLYTNLTTVALSLTSGSATDMYITNTAGCASGGVWESFNTAKNWTIAAPDGEKRIYAKTRDLSLVESTCQMVSVTLDTVSPAVAFTSPASNASVKNPVTITGTCESASGVEISGAVSGSPLTVTCSSGTFSQSVNLTGADGTKLVNLKQTDAAGNVGTSSRTFVYDSTAPVVSIGSAPTLINNANLSAANFSGSCTAADGAVSLTGNATALGTAACTSGSWNFFADLSAFADGSINFVAKQTDAAGNVGTSASVPVSKNTSVPGSFSIDGVLSDTTDDSVANNVLAATTFKIQFTSSSSANNYYFKVIKQSDSSAICGYLSTSAGPKILMTGCSLVDGTNYLIYAYSTNTYGNQTLASNSGYQFQYNLLKPKISYVTSTTSSTVFKLGDIVPITVVFDRDVVVTGSGATLALNTGGTAAYSSALDARTLLFNYTVSSTDDIMLDNATGNLNLGSMTIKDSVNGTNAILTLPATGSAGSLAVKKSLRVDGVVPTGTVNLGSVPVSLTRSPDYSVTSVSADYSTISVTMKQGATVISGPWSYTTIGSTLYLPGLNLTQGTLYSLEVTITDTAGNTSVLSRTWNAFSCPSTYGEFLFIDANPALGVTSPFCIAKYEMKNVSGLARSTPASAPWGSMSLTAAGNACLAISSAYTVPTNSEWQTVAEAVAGVSSNWNLGNIGSSSINVGNSNSASALSALASNECVTTTCSGWNKYKRTHNLPHAQIMWDFSGNLSEWVSTYDLASGYSGTAYVVDLVTALKSVFGTTTYAGCVNSGSNNCGFGFVDLNGLYYTTRGGDYTFEGYYGTSKAGIFSAAKDNNTSSVYNGFRCVYHP